MFIAETFKLNKSQRCAVRACDSIWAARGADLALIACACWQLANEHSCFVPLALGTGMTHSSIVVYCAIDMLNGVGTSSV